MKTTLTVTDLRAALSLLADDARGKARLLKDEAQAEPLWLAEALVGVEKLRAKLGKLKLPAKAQPGTTRQEIPQ